MTACVTGSDGYNTDYVRSWEPSQVAKFMRDQKVPDNIASHMEQFGVTGNMIVDGDITDSVLKGTV